MTWKTYWTVVQTVTSVHQFKRVTLPPDMEKGSTGNCNQYNKWTFQDSLQQYLAAKIAMLSHHHCLYNYNNMLNSLLIAMAVVFITAFMTTTTFPWLTVKGTSTQLSSPQVTFVKSNYLAICTSRGKEWTIWRVLHTVHKVGVFLLLKKLLRVFHWHFLDSNYHN